MTETSGFIADLPKAELHVHVEGTIEGEMVLSIADRNGIELPYKTADEVRGLQNTTKAGLHNNLQNFLKCLDLSRGVLRTPEDWHDIAEAWFKRCAMNGIVYTETLVDPQQAIRQGISLEACLDALISASDAARDSHGITTNWIVNFQRDHPAEEALALMPSLAAYQSKVVAIGVDNFETPGFPQMFQETYDAARELGFRLAAHCDVNQPDSLQHIRDCMDVLKVERIDHGLNAADDPDLTARVVEGQIALTACPTFYTSMSAAPADRLEKIMSLFEAGAAISLNTDDPAQFGSGYLNSTLTAFQAATGVGDDTILAFMKNAFRSAFLDDDVKARYLDSLDDYARGAGLQN